MGERLIQQMLYILTGLPKDKYKDKSIFTDFSNCKGKKIICGTSTMKAYCKHLNLKPEITFINIQHLPVAKYKIEGIFLATEGIITLNECYKKLNGQSIENQEAVMLAELLMKENKIIFIVGTAPNKDTNLYRTNNLLPRDEIVNKIIDLLQSDKKITAKKV